MPRTQSPIDDEKRSYGAVWLISALLLLLGAMWAILDDNVFRRPWKYFQAEFNRIEIRKIESEMAAEQQRLDADPAYQEASKALAAARARLASGDTQRRLADLQADLDAAKRADQSKDLDLRFVKSELEELRYHYDDALHHGEPVEHIQAEIDQRETVRVERSKAYEASQQHIAAIENEIKALGGEVKAAEDAIAKLATHRAELQDRLENVALGYYPGPKAEFPFFGWDWQPKIPKIQQVVLPEFDRNNFDQPVGRVDRCTSCHAGINKAGFEDQPNPWKTHPERELLLGKHPPEKFGCTPCHGGEGPDVNAPERAHGNFYDEHGHLETIEFQEHPMLRKEKMTAACIKCHQGVRNLEGAGEIARGESLFVELGCHGCHLAEGYEELSKQDGTTAVGPSLRRIGAKLDHGWMVRWITNPHAVRPRTRMPNFMFQEDQAVQIAAYLLGTTKDPSAEWLAGRQTPSLAGADPARGRALMDSLGCRACHALAEDEVAGQIGANKDIAPNLSHVAEKTDARWIYHWIRNPRGYSHVARMPSLRLSDDEARDVTAYLVTLGERQPEPADLEARLADPQNVAAGEKLVRKYGCPGCHDIPGMETESRIGAELSYFGNKTKEELFFGDRTDLPEDWDTWTFHKLKEPRGYATRWIEQVMPQFDLADDDILALRTFLASRTEQRVPPKYTYRSAVEKQVVAGRNLVARYNCTGCHVIEGQGGDIRRLYAEAPTMAPPLLNGEGEKVQADWLFNFVKAPVPIRPWLHVRMPTFGLSDQEANTVVGYFDGLSHVEVPFVHLEKAAFDPGSVEAGRLLMSRDYFDCFNCHQQGDKKPQGPPDGWAPDLTLAAQRLNPEWIVKWLRDPQKLMPGTKMPTFYPDPDAPDGPPDILGGDDEAQIRALRDYILWIGMSDAHPTAASPQQQAATPPAPAS
jgi:cytochrome c2